MTGPGFMRRPVFRLMLSRRGALNLIAPLALLEALIDGGLTLSYKYLVDWAIIPGNARALVLILSILAAAVLTGSILTFWRDFRHARMATAILDDIRNALFQATQRLPFKYHETHSSSEILTRFSSDLSVLETWLAGAINTLVLPAAQVAVGTVLLFVFLPWPLAMLGMMAWPLVLIGPRVIAPRAAAASYEKKQSESGLLTTVAEIISAQKIARIYGLNVFTQQRFQQSLEPLTRDTQRATWLGMLVERTTVATIYGIQVAALAAGAWLAFRGRISLGTFVAFLTVFWNLGWSIVVLARSAPSLVSAAGSVRRIDELLEDAAVGGGGEGTVPALLQNSIRLDRVNFGYAGRPNVLSGISLEIRRGEFVAIVGGSGSGKSTVLNLLIPFDSPDSGRVLVDGLDLETIDVKTWRSRMGFVLQESILFNISIRENIRLGRPEADDAAVEAAAGAAELHDAISRLPEGYDTVVGERGSRLSGGQLQRVAIARALIRNPDILLLDEATSALDPASESAVNETLLRAARGRTTIAVTHRLASITQASRIFVLQHGQVAEHGSHEDLLGRDGVYAGLWRKQNGFVVSADGGLAEISANRLREIDLLRPLSLSQLEELASRFVCERASAGQVIFREGDHSELFYVIARGLVVVTRQGRNEGEGVIKLTEMGVGDEFGEMGLLNDAPRNATVTAKTNCLLLTLTRNHFFDLLKDSPDVKTQVEAIAAKRARPAPERKN